MTAQIIQLRTAGGHATPPAATVLAGWQRDRATARAAALAEVERVAGELGSVQAAIDHLRLAPSTVWRWRAQFRSGGFAALAPRAPARPQQPVPPWAQTFLKLHQTPQKRALAAVVRDLASELPAGIAPPSISQVRRWWRKLSAVESARGRHGPHALKAVRAFVRRDTAGMMPTDCYLADGHRFDAEVAHPRHGGPFRPELTIVLDVATRKAVGWSAAVAESTWAVADALRHAVTTHGIPALYYSDRGPGHRNDALDGMLARLGVAREFSLPRNSQARGVIERFNRSLVAEAKRLPTYLGADMDGDARNLVHKATRAELREVGASRLLMAWSDFLDFVAGAIDAYKARPHRALPRIDGRHMSPGEAWQAALEAGVEPMLPGQDEADDLFRPYEVRTTRRGEIALFGNRYFARDLEHLHGAEVMVGYDLHDPSHVWVRDLEERLVAIAGLDANRTPFFPAPRIEQAREQRARGRLRRIDARREEALAELDGPPVVEHTPEPPPSWAPPIGRRRGPPAAINNVTARAAVWATIKRLTRGGAAFTKAHLALQAGVGERLVGHYVVALVEAGLLTRTPGARPNDPSTYRLAVDAGAEPPRVQTGGKVAARPNAQELLWHAIKGLRTFNVVELGEAAGVPRSTATGYIKHLHKAGDLGLVERSGPDRPARWLLVPQMDTGPQAPAVRWRDKAVFDRNLGRQVWPSKAA
jgi:putative transposase